MRYLHLGLRYALCTHISHFLSALKWNISYSLMSLKALIALFSSTRLTLLLCEFLLNSASQLCLTTTFSGETTPFVVLISPPYLVALISDSVGITHRFKKKTNRCATFPTITLYFPNAHIPHAKSTRIPNTHVSTYRE